MNADRFVAGSSDPSEWYVEVLALRARLAEAEEALAALRSGAADALHCDTGVLYRSGADSAYVAFFNAMNEGGATLDGNGTILYCNPRFSAMTGRPADELRGRALLSCVIEPDRPPVPHCWNRMGRAPAKPLWMVTAPATVGCGLPSPPSTPTSAASAA